GCFPNASSKRCRPSCRSGWLSRDSKCESASPRQSSKVGEPRRSALRLECSRAFAPVAQICDRASRPPPRLEHFHMTMLTIEKGAGVRENDLPWVDIAVRPGYKQRYHGFYDASKQFGPRHCTRTSGP